MPVPHVLDNCPTNLGTSLRGIRRCTKTLNLLRARESSVDKVGFRSHVTREAEKALLAAGFPHACIFRPAYIYPVELRKEPNFG